MPSILKVGIVSHNKSLPLGHVSVADAVVQQRRSQIIVPGGRRLHDYVNLYICARNPMMFKLRGQHTDLCVLKVSTDVLDIPDAVITDRNASSDYARFARSPEGLAIVVRELTFAEYWTDLDKIRYFQKESAKCAEVLIPDCVRLEFVSGVYVSCKETSDRFIAMDSELPVTINGNLFFR